MAVKRISNDQDIHTLSEKEMKYLDEAKQYFNIKNLLSCLMYYEIGSAYLDDGDNADILAKVVDRAERFENPIVCLLVEQVALSHELEGWAGKGMLFDERRHTFKYRPTEKQPLNPEQIKIAKQVRAEVRMVNSLILQLEKLATQRKSIKGELQQLTEHTTALDAIIRERAERLAERERFITRKGSLIEKKRLRNLKNALALIEKNIP